MWQSTVQRVTLEFANDISLMVVHLFPVALTTVDGRIQTILCDAIGERVKKSPRNGGKTQPLRGGGGGVRIPGDCSDDRDGYNFANLRH